MQHYHGCRRDTEHEQGDRYGRQLKATHSQLFPDPHFGDRPPELLFDAALAAEGVVGVLMPGAVFRTAKAKTAMQL